MECCNPITRNRARFKGLIYAVVMLVVLAMEMCIMYVSAMVCDASRRPYVWLSWGFSCLLSSAHVGFIVTWTVAAATDNVQWMTVGITGVAVRLLGRVVYSTMGAIISMTTKPTVSETIAMLTLHTEEQPSMLFSPMYPTLILLSIELCFVTGLNTYSEVCKRAVEEDNNNDSGNVTSNAAGSKDDSKADV